MALSSTGKGPGTRASSQSGRRRKLAPAKGRDNANHRSSRLQSRAGPAWRSTLLQPIATLIQRLSAWLRGFKRARPRRPPRAARLPAQGQNADLTPRGAALLQGHAAVRETLKSDPAIRRLAPHLAVLEREVRHRGADVIERMSSHFLDKALAQTLAVSRLVSAEHRTGLMIWHKVLEAHAKTAPSAASPWQERIEVAEVSYEDFEEWERSLKGSALPTTAPIKESS